MKLSLGKYTPVLLASLFCLPLTVLAERSAEESEQTRKAALFILNRGGEELVEYRGIFEDLLQGKMSGAGFEIISPDIAMAAVSSLDGISQNSLDRDLEDQTTALRLGQNLQADYLIVATLTSLGRTSQAIQAYGVDVINEKFTLRTSYRVLDAVNGGTLVSSTAISEKVYTQSKHSQTITNDTLPELLDDAATKISSAFVSAASRETIRAVEREREMVPFYIMVTLQDLTVPDVIRDENGELQVTSSNYQLEQTGVTVELNGVVIGTSNFDQPLHALPGIHRIRLTREGFEPWERIINISENLRLTVAMQLSEEGFIRWRENAGFLQQLRRDRQLTDAEAEVLQGIATYYRQSGIRIRREEDIRIDADQAPDIHIKRQSLFD